MGNKAEKCDFRNLVDTIRQVNKDLATQAGRAVNVSLTLRNWLIGAYIDEYELSGADRANYGDKLLTKLSHELQKHKISNSGHRQLYQIINFTRPEGGDNTSSISPTDNAVKLFMWKSICTQKDHTLVEYALAGMDNQLFVSKYQL